MTNFVSATRSRTAATRTGWFTMTCRTPTQTLSCADSGPQIQQGCHQVEQTNLLRFGCDLFSCGNFLCYLVCGVTGCPSATVRTVFFFLHFGRCLIFYLLRRPRHEQLTPPFRKPPAPAPSSPSSSPSPSPSPTGSPSPPALPARNNQQPASGGADANADSSAGAAPPTPPKSGLSLGFVESR